MSRRSIKWSDAAWVLAMGAQGGLMIALPVLLGLAVGFWLDSQFDTLPWISLVFVLIGTSVGPILLYRWVISSVAQRAESRMKRSREEQDEEMAE
jgi:F0F1-type ATP synthase assembly protein I